MSKQMEFTLVSGGFEASVSYHKLALICSMLHDACGGMEMRSGDRYAVLCRVPREHLQNFVDYVERVTEGRESQRSVITKENYASLVALAEEFECEQLQEDLSLFKSSWSERVDEMMTELIESGEDERVRVLEDELSDDVDVLLERIEDLRFRDLSVKSLWNILSKSQGKGCHINSTELCRYILCHPSYSPLLEFVSLSEVPARMALQVLEGDNTQDWVSPKTFFPFMSEVLQDVEVVKQELENSKAKIDSLERKSAFLEENLKAYRGSCRPMERDFVISWLRARELEERRKLVIVRRSSDDIYNWLEPDNPDEYVSSKMPSAWVEIEFHTPIRINGFEVTSSSAYRGFPKTFDVTFYGGAGNREEWGFSFVDEARMNCLRGSVEATLDVFSTKLIRIESRGPNWSDTDSLRLGGFELFSPDEQYRDGVFRSIFASHRENVYEIFDVRARDFDGSEIHKRDTAKAIRTDGRGPNQWIEVGLVHGKMMVTGYRIRSSQKNLRSWSLRGSNDRSARLEEWTVIHRQFETERTDRELRFECWSVTPFKFFRIVQEGLSWVGDNRLYFNYFDFDGVFIPV